MLFPMDSGFYLEIPDLTCICMTVLLKSKYFYIRSDTSNVKTESGCTKMFITADIFTGYFYLKGFCMLVAIFFFFFASSSPTFFVKVSVMRTGQFTAY